MPPRDDYISGPHSYWTHFICGFILGGASGAYTASGFHAGGWITFAVAAATGLALALACGRWGDRVWKSILENWPLWW